MKLLKVTDSRESSEWSDIKLLRVIKGDKSQTNKKVRVRDEKLAMKEGEYKNFTGFVIYGPNEGPVTNADFILKDRKIIFKKGGWDKPPEFAGKDGSYKNFTGWIEYDGSEGQVENADFILKGGKIIWSKGRWTGGRWRDGTWENGTWLNGIWEDGVWKKGTWKTGTWEDGKWRTGTWKGGRWIKGYRISRGGDLSPEKESPDKWQQGGSKQFQYLEVGYRHDVDDNYYSYKISKRGWDNSEQKFQSKKEAINALAKLAKDLEKRNKSYISRWRKGVEERAEKQKQHYINYAMENELPQMQEILEKSNKLLDSLKAGVIWFKNR